MSYIIKNETDSSASEICSDDEMKAIVRWYAAAMRQLGKNATAIEIAASRKLERLMRKEHP